jgi:N6-adenosine-specific RNA methylase IME4
MTKKKDVNTSPGNVPRIRTDAWVYDGVGHPVFLLGDDLDAARDEWLARERRVDAEYLHMGAIASAVSRGGKYGNQDLEKLAKMLGKNYKVLDDRKRVYERIADLEISDRSEILAKLKSGLTNYTKLLVCAPIADTRTFLDVTTRLGEDGSPVRTSVVRREAGEIKEAQRASDLQSTAQANPLLPWLLPGRYRTLVVDPPWEMQLARTGANKHRSSDWHMYSYMTEAELAELEPMHKLPAEQSHLYLWTPHRHLKAALRLVDAWGFRFYCVLVWQKDRGMVAYSWRYDTELVIFATRGGLGLDSMGESQHFFAKAREHSRKPKEFYDLVRRVSPEPRVDVFSREDRPGFDSWGDEQGLFSGQPRLPLADNG